MTRQTRKKWLTICVIIGIPGLFIHTVQEITTINRGNKRDKALDQVRHVQDIHDQAMDTDPDSIAALDTAQSMQRAKDAFNLATNQPENIPLWLHIPTGILSSFCLWGAFILYLLKPSLPHHKDQPISRLTQKKWLIIFITIGTPCMFIQSINQITKSHNLESWHKSFDQVFFAYHMQEWTQAIDPNSTASLEADQYLQLAQDAQRQSSLSDTIHLWLNIPTGILSFVCFWGSIYLAYIIATPNHQRTQPND